MASCAVSIGQSRWLGLVIALGIWWIGVVHGMSRAQLADLRQETVDMFYHGYDNYMAVAFPEDELRPVSCEPLTRDRRDPANIGLNDVLGNYSLTLIDSLSTLALLATSKSSFNGKRAASRHFQEGVAALVEQYGDGSDGPRGQGLRGRGFDTDSKVQVFETVIRGVGGLLSAHLFAIGELPSPGKSHGQKTGGGRQLPLRIAWQRGFTYDGQLLRLAHDLGKRLLPAFYTPTAIPYPRVNLRHGIPFYLNSPLHQDGADGQCNTKKPATPEVTETCSAGAGSLVLEFTTLSRLTGDARFEKLAKRAFWEVWKKRSSIGLIGAGLDAESGLWTGPITGIGAGIDSFFEYALKSHILLSGSSSASSEQSESHNHPDPNTIHRPLTAEEDSPRAFLDTWQAAHSAIERHLYRDLHHPHYINAHLNTGSPQYLWIDSLGAYYPGLLALSGHLEEAISTNLLYTALWTRYSALPERWSSREGVVEGGLGWWPGRPEFIESNYHLYRATRDPWYLYVGEMVLRDIKRRCWTRCGWAGLQDVRSGEWTDRMESFFLGETAKYLFLLFDEAHPLNQLDGAFVFTTEGHPLILPKSGPSRRTEPEAPNHLTCPRAPLSLPLTVSPTAARPDIFHASSMARLHLVPSLGEISTAAHPPVIEYNIHHPSLHPHLLPQSPSNYIFYPWTLPPSFVPPLGVSSPLSGKTTFEIQFPSTTPTSDNAGGLPSGVILGNPDNVIKSVQQLQAFTRVDEGMVINSLQGLRLGMILDDSGPESGGGLYRIFSVGGFHLGRDERVFLKKELLPGGDEGDPNFRRVQDEAVVELVIALDHSPDVQSPSNPSLSDDPASTAPEEQRLLEATNDVLGPSSDLDASSGSVLDPDPAGSDLNLDASASSLLSTLLQQFTSFHTPTSPPPPPPSQKIHLRATTATGRGAPSIATLLALLPLSSIYISPTLLCTTPLAGSIPRDHQIILIPRGGCSFLTKLSNIPSFPASASSLQLVVVVSSPTASLVGEDGMPGAEDEIRPLLEAEQTTPSGKKRRRPIPLVLVSGAREEVVDVFARVGREEGEVTVEGKWRVVSGGRGVGNVVVV